MEVIQPKDRFWHDSPYHTPILYTVKDAGIKVGKGRASKTMLCNRRNTEEAGEWYREQITELMRTAREVGSKWAQEVFKEIARCITEPWVNMAERKPATRSANWNAGLQMRWESLRKPRVRARKSATDTDREHFESKRKEFRRAKRRRKRALGRNTAKLL